MKHFKAYVIAASAIFVVYAVLALWLDREAARQHEKEFNEQQALQIQVAARRIEDHFAWQLHDMQTAANYVIPQYLNGNSAPTIARSILTATGDSLEAERLAVVFSETPATLAVLHKLSGSDGTRAVRLLAEWLQTYWEPVRASGQVWVTPFYLTPSRQFYGLLLPVYVEGEFAGILAAALNLAPVLERYVMPVGSGKHREIWVQDADSRVHYDEKEETIGQYVTHLAEPYPGLYDLNDRLMTEAEGQDDYHYTDELNGRVVRNLVAWATVAFGSQRLTLVLAAPDTEISADLGMLREQSLALGALLGLTLVCSGALFYYLRQSALQKEVTVRTSELQQLTADLEHRVARRTTQLEQERAQLRTILEAMDEGILYRQGPQVLYVNPALTQMLGYTADELLTRSRAIFQAVTAHADAAVIPDAPGDLPVGIWRREARLTRQDGTQFEASVYLARVHNRQNQPLGTVEIIRDISREKSLQAQRDRFITNAAHELRRPLSNLKTRIYLLGRQPEKLLEHVEIIQKATDDMSDLVQDLVDMAQLASNELSLNCRNLVLQHVLQSALDIQQAHAFQVRVKLNIEMPDVLIQIYADYQRLTQTFNNLLAHAIQSTAPDGQVGLRLWRQADQAIIEIDDDGPAVDPVQLTYIFEPFFQPSEGNVQRTGMGLALARKIVEQHGGRISATSTADYNRLMVQLPLHEESE